MNVSPPIPLPPDPRYYRRWDKRAAPLLTEVAQWYGLPPGQPVLSQERR